jgi:hypothetical protein
MSHLDRFSQKHGIAPVIESYGFADAWLRHKERPKAPVPSMPFFWQDPSRLYLPYLATPTFVQATGLEQANSLTIIQAYASALTNPSLLVISFEATATSITITSVVDTAANTYILGESRDNGSGWEVFTYYALNTSTQAGNTVTVTSTSSNLRRLTVSEYTGCATSSPLDQVNGQNGTSTSPTSPSVTTTTDGQLIYGFIFTLGGSIVAGSGYTIRTAPGGFVAVEDKVQTSQGSIAADYTTGSAFGTGYTAQILTFKAAGGGGGSPLRLNSLLNGLSRSGGGFANPLG